MLDAEVVRKDKNGGAADLCDKKNNKVNDYSMTPGAWAFETFKRKAKWLTRINGFSYEDGTLMEAWAMADILEARDGYDPASGRTREQYYYTVISNALTSAAQKIADSRAVWSNSRRSLDAQSGTGEDTRTVGDLVQAQADTNANEKLGGEPFQIRVRRQINRLKRRKDAEALEKLRRRLQSHGQPVLTDADEHPDEEPRTGPDFIEDVSAEEEELAERGNVGVSDFEDLNRLAYSMHDQHDDAVAEMGLADDPDEDVPEAVHANRLSGFGDCARAVFLEALHRDVVILLNDLDPKLRRWCEYVLRGYSKTEARAACRIGKSSFYDTVIPRLRRAFAGLRYAL